jgi:hypothetical protein
MKATDECDSKSALNRRNMLLAGTTPPMQVPASFNLEAVKRKVDELMKEHEGQ